MRPPCEMAGCEMAGYETIGRGMARQGAGLRPLKARCIFHTLPHNRSSHAKGIVMKLRKSDPWMPAAAYGQSLQGLTVNLLVREIDRAATFQTAVLGAEIVYSDPDFAVLRGYGAEWMLHADHAYEAHPLAATLPELEARGGTVELRLHGCDPDRAVAAAREAGGTVLADPADKPHGLREAYILDANGYVWVPDVPTA